MVRALVEAGYQVGIASNFDHRLRSVVEGLPGIAEVRHLVIELRGGLEEAGPAVLRPPVRGGGACPGAGASRRRRPRQ